MQKSTGDTNAAKRPETEKHSKRAREGGRARWLMERLTIGIWKEWRRKCIFVRWIPLNVGTDRKAIVCSQMLFAEKIFVVSHCSRMRRAGLGHVSRPLERPTNWRKLTSICPSLRVPIIGDVTDAQQSLYLSCISPLLSPSLSASLSSWHLFVCLY